MASNRFNKAFTINIKASLEKYLLIIIPHLLVAIVLMIFFDVKEQNLIYLIIILLCISISLLYFSRLHILFQSEKSIYEIHKNTSGHWKLKLKNGLTKDVTILTSSFVSNLLILIIFKDQSSKDYTALVTPDSVSTNEFRRLKVHLKTNRQKI